LSGGGARSRWHSLVVRNHGASITTTHRGLLGGEGEPGRHRRGIPARPRLLDGVLLGSAPPATAPRSRLEPQRPRPHALEARARGRGGGRRGAERVCGGCQDVPSPSPKTTIQTSGRTTRMPSGGSFSRVSLRAAAARAGTWPMLPRPHRPPPTTRTAPRAQASISSDHPGHSAPPGGPLRNGWLCIRAHHGRGDAHRHGDGGEGAQDVARPLERGKAGCARDGELRRTRAPCD
jgi:hypothetical protein